MSSNPIQKRAWATLLTRESYLAGVVLLAHSLHKQKSQYPLIILYTPTLSLSVLPLLQHEAGITNAMIHPIEILAPMEQGTLIAERFRDTWTKLRVFQLFDWDRICFLDADMLVLSNMDELFEMNFPDSGTWLAANHVCVCNLDGDKWAPEDWKVENCAYTGLTHPTALTKPCPASDGKNTHGLLNSGLFLFEPSLSVWNNILTFLNTSPLVKDFLFPDQDFLAEVFKGRWVSIGWQYNALKTWRYWHANIWRDEEVKNLHYIVDKPWAKRVGKDGRAGYLGNDGETHQWWWKEYEDWKRERQLMGENTSLELMREHTAKPLDTQ
jgi:inositol 3-alpha-galactosyltransferase